MLQVNTRLFRDFFQRKFISALKLSFVYCLVCTQLFRGEKKFDGEIFAIVYSWTWSRIKSCRYVTLLLVFLKLFIINLLEAISACAPQIGKIIYLQLYVYEERKSDNNRYMNKDCLHSYSASCNTNDVNFSRGFSHWNVFEFLTYNIFGIPNPNKSVCK
jgi:hypothetical protein